MLPLTCDVDRKGFPFVTILLIIICGAFFFGPVAVGRGSGIVPLDLAYALFHPRQEGIGAAVDLATSFFLHANLVHLLSNMWFLWIFGAAVEKSLGMLPFALAYGICGVASMLIQACSNPLSPIPIVGASGAIAGVMGIHFVLSPLSRVLVWLPPIFFSRVPAFLFLAFWFWLQYSNIIRPATAGGGVAWWAHAGGFLTGALIGAGMRMGILPSRNGGKR